MPVRLSNLHLLSSSFITKHVNQNKFAMMGETSSFVDRFHYKKAENVLYCKEYVLPDVTPYFLVYTRHVYHCKKISPKIIVF